MSKSSLAAGRGGSIYRVTCLRANEFDARTATELDFFTLVVQAPNALSARLKARNEHPDVGGGLRGGQARHGMKRDQVELRGLVPRYVVDVVDAVAIYKGLDRIEVVRLVLQEWADQKMREAKLIGRMVEGNDSKP